MRPWPRLLFGNEIDLCIVPLDTTARQSSIGAMGFNRRKMEDQRRQAAVSRRPARGRCPLSGVKRTSRFQSVMSVFDPIQKSSTQNCCDAQRHQVTEFCATKNPTCPLLSVNPNPSDACCIRCNSRLPFQSTSVRRLHYLLCWRCTDRGRCAYALCQQTHLNTWRKPRSGTRRYPSRQAQALVLR
jgi:hypothetical protein